MIRERFDRVMNNFSFDPLQNRFFYHEKFLL